MPQKMLTLLVALMLVSTSAYSAMKPGQAITARKSVMKVIGLNFGPMGAMVKGKIPFNEDVFKANALRVRLVAEMPYEDYFPKGSEKGKRTTVKASVWEDWGEFKEYLGDLRKESARLADVANSGNRDEIRKQFLATAKTCKKCHDEFREK